MMTPEEEQAALEAYQRMIRRRLRTARVIVVFGAVLISLGVGFIFWPAALIVFGCFAVLGGSYLVDIPDESQQETPER